MKTLTLLYTSLLSLTAHAWTENFEFDFVPNPPGVDPQVGGMDVMKDGRIAVAFHRGEVMIYDPSSDSWSLFAKGLHEPLGLLVEDDGSIMVMQRPELTRLKDTDGDGSADFYQTVFDDFGMSGNYHEFAFGPVRDSDGNFFVGLNVASNGSHIREEIRGEFSEIGQLNREEMTQNENWNKRKKKAGRMYSRVPYRGWIMKISPDGQVVEPFASGFRSPDGIGFDAKGRLIVTDNQGDWRPTSPLYHVKKGKFYGHPASLVWDENWEGGDPLQISVNKLDSMQEPAAGYFPQGELANSPTQPIVIPEGAFPEGMDKQTLVGEMNQKNLIRVLEDEVDGTFQTALSPMFDGSPLGSGNHRMVFGKDGWLYIGKTALSWPGSNGISRIKWNGKPFLYLMEMKATKDGFTLAFSMPLDPGTISDLEMKSHTYEYHENYGSKKKDENTLTVEATELSDDGMTLKLDLGGLKEGYLHFADLTKLKSKDGKEILGGKAWYHAVKVPKS